MVLKGEIRAVKIYLEKYNKSGELTEKNLNPDEIIRIVCRNKKSETNDVIS